MPLPRPARAVIATLLALPLAAVIAGQAGLFQGRAPADLGVQADGRLQPPSTTPNSVSSQSRLWPEHPRRDAAFVEPLPLAPTADPASDPAAAMARLRAAVAAMPGGVVVEERPGYLRAQFRTRWLGFVDDAEFAADPSAGVIHVRSASRVGHGDWGVNRARIEQLRVALAG